MTSNNSIAMRQGGVVNSASELLGTRYGALDKISANEMPQPGYNFIHTAGNERLISIILVVQRPSPRIQKLKIGGPRALKKELRQGHISGEAVL